MNAEKSDDLELTLDEERVLVFEFRQRGEDLFDDDLCYLLSDLAAILLREEADLWLLRVVAAEHAAVWQILLLSTQTVIDTLSADAATYAILEEYVHANNGSKSIVFPHV